MVCPTQVRSNYTRFDFPLVVLTRRAMPADPAEAPDELELIETNLQREFLKLSPDSRQVIAKQNDHFIPTSEPELVIEAIRQVVEEVRS